jgi:hypothetical protein
MLDLAKAIAGCTHAPGARQTTHRFRRGGVKRGVRRNQEEWTVLIHDHHEGYISWEQYERNQRLIGDNANMKGAMVTGSVRKGGGLLAGLLRCGHCGRKLVVQHNGGRRNDARYLCNGASIRQATREKCISFVHTDVDTAVSAEVLRVISPLATEAALAAVADRERVGSDRLAQLELALEQARFEAARAGRQYNAVDPENRIVAAELERRWNDRLGEAARLEDEIRSARQAQPAAGISESERAALMELADDLPRAWDHPAATAETRKKILRAVFEETVVHIE